jgi:uncharacterized protein
MDIGVPIELHQSAALAAACVVVSALTFATLLRDAWQARAVRAASALVAGYLVVVHARWAYGMHVESWPIAHESGIWALVALVPLVLLVWSLPIAGLVWQVLRGRPDVRAPVTPPSSEEPPCSAPREPDAVERWRTVTATKADSPRLGRRQVAKVVASAVPLVTLGAAGKGYESGLRLPVLRPVPMPYPSLHPDLRGLTILHLSDLHLGFVRAAHDLEAVLERLPAQPDLVVLTGDVADDLHQLERALCAVRNVAPRVGVFSVLGNHEYLHDAEFARDAHRRARVPLLVGEGATVSVGNAKLHIAGADDPVRLHGDITEFMDATVASAMRGASEDAFRLLLSHRPEGFVAGARHGAHLTLSGHTHGGQIGFNGKSAFEPIWSERYLWGSFRRGRSRLYTTSGFGHWFPFRLGCPTEVPLVTLVDESPAPALLSDRGPIVPT